MRKEHVSGTGVDPFTQDSRLSCRCASVGWRTLHPQGAGRGPSIRSARRARMAKRLGMSQSTVSRVWRAFGLAPHRQDSWKLSKRSAVCGEGARCRRAVSEPARACGGALRGRKNPDPGAQPNPTGVSDAARHTSAASHDYVRHGASHLYAALDLASGKVIGALHSRHRAQEFLTFLKEIDADVPADLDCHVVLGQHLHPQDPGGQTVAGRPSALRTALHPDQRLLAEPGRTLLRRTDHQKTAARHPHLGSPTLDRNWRRWESSGELPHNVARCRQAGAGPSHLLRTGPPYWQPALARGAEAISSAAVSIAANPPTMPRFMVVSRHIAAGAFDECLGWQIPSTAQPATHDPTAYVAGFCGL